MSAWRESSDGPVRVLTLARPPGNALDLATLSALREAVVRAGGDAAARAVVLESEVPRYFSSGLDLEEMAGLPEPRRREPFESLLDAYRALLECPKPVVAALSGSALLGGWVLAMACDWRVAAPTAKISLSEIRAALTPTCALVGRLSALAADPRVVKEMVLRGKTVGAEAALAAGLLDEVRPEAEVRPAARALAAKLAKSPPRAFASIKRTLNAAAADEGLRRRALSEFGEVFAGEEAHEGVAALREKRRPRWEGA
jgi:enoyl-CoA hydratase/carnithine racemase